MLVVTTARAALVFVVLLAVPARADDESPALHAGLRLGADYTTTVDLGDGPDALLLAGIDADAVFEHLVLGGELSAEGGPFAHGVVFGGLHGGAQVLEDSMHAMATLAIGGASISHICSGCDSATLAYTELRGTIAYAWTHAELGVWVAGRADLGRQTMTGAGGDIHIGGYSLGGGLTVAYLSR